MNPYQILEISEEATEVEIRKAYKKQALRYHPDKVTDPAEKEANEIKFKEITHAYEILTNKNGTGHSSFDDPDDADFMNFFTQDFSGYDNGPPPPPPNTMKNEDVVIEIKLTMKELYNGKNIKFQLSRNVVCELCEGNGWKRRKNGNLYDPPLIDCRKCSGKGYTERKLRTPFGFNTIQRRACTKCMSHGKVRARPTSDKNKCKKCRGDGLLKVDENVTISIPRGYVEGDKITLKKLADQTLDGKEPGDIIFVVKQEKNISVKSPNFEKRGNNLYMTTTISLLEAISGFESKFLTETFDDRKLTWSSAKGKVIRPGDILKISNEGWPISDESKHNLSFGDLYVTINIEFPPDNWFSEKNDLIQLQNILPEGRQSTKIELDPRNSENITNYEIVNELPSVEEHRGSNNPYENANPYNSPGGMPQGAPECATQ